ncbi:RlpA-like double-psi beta-barrel-protein domain-containing protein-containing protein [Paraphoma chrysanthemicola]|uniref:RlpA-like double-psi beta-barrel-protein domain-containing protein-containing protein n=1 Tax=Paraphoma chrysanthemicola TaxID=798071 RepID=A0A8K0QWR0_9PLEO|nr:RlpA-like double-psi beta-barrel-protein domain-containing protein-containing protein [Paraphoma chrysanthemicola]
MSAFTIPRKEIGEPSPAHLKEVDTARSTDSGWEATETGQSKRRHIHMGMGASTAGWAFSDRFDRILPPHRRYFGRSRRTLLIAILITFLCLLALIIGLAVGLSAKKKGPQNLPLPNGAETYTGELTYYNPGLGACGIDSTDNDAVVAVSHYTFDAVQTGSDPNQNPLCHRKIRATRVNEKTGKSVSIDVTVIDRCTGCQPTDLDVSPAMFKQMADPDLGRVPVTWAWL